MLIFPIPSWDVASMWKEVEPHLQRALDRQHKLRLEDIKGYCEQNLMQLWYVPDTHALVTQIQNYPLCRILLILLCGGHGLECGPGVIAELKAYARAMRCDEIEIQGRPGWTCLGFEKTDTVMRMKI